jgi:hypothetical protein
MKSNCGKKQKKHVCILTAAVLSQPLVHSVLYMLCLLFDRLEAPRLPGPNGAASNSGGLGIWAYQGLPISVWLNRRKRSVLKAPGT